MCSGVPIEDIYHSVLERSLDRRAEGGMGTEFINFGVGGYDFRDYMSVVKNKALQYEPDLILIGFCPNTDYRVRTTAELERRYVPKEIPNSFFVPYSLEFSRLAISKFDTERRVLSSARSDLGEEDTKKVHGRIQIRDREVGKAKRSFDVEHCDGTRSQRQVHRRMGSKG
jgi:hypothetical protein